MWKPSRNSYHSNYQLMQLMMEAGMPPGVVNFVPGNPRMIVDTCLENRDFAGVHFTGSTRVFQGLWGKIAESLPRLRSYPRIVGETGGKDFIVAPYQLLEAVAAGADAVLLIVAALDDTELGALLKEATALGLAAMVEVHDGAELRRAVQAGATVIGVNNRNLRTLAVDVNVSRNLVVQMPPGTVAVAESGLRTSADLVDLGAAGYHAFLIGETLITTPEPGETLGRLIDGARPASSGVGTSVSGVEAGGS